MRPTQVLYRDCSNIQHLQHPEQQLKLQSAPPAAVCCAALHFDLSIKGKVYLWISDFNSTAQPERPQRYRYIEPRSNHHHPYGLNCMNYFDKIQNTTVKAAQAAQRETNSGKSHVMWREASIFLPQNNSLTECNWVESPFAHIAQLQAEGEGEGEGGRVSVTGSA